MTTLKNYKEFPPTDGSASSYVVHDVTNRVEPRAFYTREEASKWLAHLTEWQPESRPVIAKAADLILEALKAGLACADNCTFNAAYHKRTIQTVLILFPQNGQDQAPQLD